MVARQTASVIWEGQTLVIQGGVTTAREGHPILDAYRAEFEPLTVTFEVDGDPTPAAPPAQAAPAAPPAPAPAPADVRVWAAEQGIEVSAKGKLPADVVDAYVAAHQEA